MLWHDKGLVKVAMHSTSTWNPLAATNDRHLRLYFHRGVGRRAASARACRAFKFALHNFISSLEEVCCLSLVSNTRERRELAVFPRRRFNIAFVENRCIHYRLNQPGFFGFASTFCSVSASTGLFTCTSLFPGVGSSSCSILCNASLLKRVFFITT